MKYIGILKDWTSWPAIFNDIGTADQSPEPKLLCGGVPALAQPVFKGGCCTVPQIQNSNKWASAARYFLLTWNWTISQLLYLFLIYASSWEWRARDESTAGHGRNSSVCMQLCLCPTTRAALWPANLYWVHCPLLLPLRPPARAKAEERQQVGPSMHIWFELFSRDSLLNVHFYQRDWLYILQTFLCNLYLMFSALPHFFLTWIS